MKDKIKGFFTTNLIWKSLSIIISIFLWFVVMNINNPTEIRTFSFGVTVLNENILAENNLTLLNLDEIEKTRINVKIKATRTTLYEISKLEDLGEAKFTIDLSSASDYDIGEQPLVIPISVTTDIPNIPYPNNNFEVSSYSPATISIVIDEIITEPKRITYDVVGKLDSGYISLPPITNTEYVQVTGPKSVIKSINTVAAKIDLSNKTSTIAENVPIMSYDNEGNVIEGLSYNLETVFVEVPINKETGIPVQQPLLIGTLPSGYIVKNISYSPKFIEVTGEADDIKRVGEIVLPPIDITGLTSTKTATFSVSNILETNNLDPVNNTDTIVVNVEIAKANTKTLSINENNIAIVDNDENFIVDIKDISQVTIAGKDELLSNVNTDNLTGFINIGGLNDGEHKLGLNLSIPSGLTVVTPAEVTVIIQRVDTEDEQTQTEPSSEQTTEEQTEEDKTEESSLETTDQTTISEQSSTTEITSKKTSEDEENTKEKEAESTE